MLIFVSNCHQSQSRAEEKVRDQISFCPTSISSRKIYEVYVYQCKDEIQTICIVELKYYRLCR